MSKKNEQRWYAIIKCEKCDSCNICESTIPEDRELSQRRFSCRDCGHDTIATDDFLESGLSQNVTPRPTSSTDEYKKRSMDLAEKRYELDAMRTRIECKITTPSEERQRIDWLEEIAEKAEAECDACGMVTHVRENKSGMICIDCLYKVCEEQAERIDQLTAETTQSEGDRDGE